MLEAFVVTLREGVEAALAVVLILAVLRKGGRAELARIVFWGMGAAALLSVAGAVAVRRSGFDPEGRTEGIVLAVSALLVAWLVVWMWSHGKELRGATERKLGEILARPSAAQKTGLFLFSFLVVFREGVETVLMLSALQFTTDAVLSAAGAAAGLAVAVVFGVAFYKGAFRIDLGKFFFVTSVVLLILVVQLVLLSLHEFAEAGDLGSFGPGYMKTAGPLLRNSLLFILAMLALPFVLLIGSVLRRASAAANPAEERKERAGLRTQRAALVVFCLVALGTIGTLGWTYAQEKRDLKIEPPALVEPISGEIFVTTARLDDGKLHRYAVAIDGKLVRFLAMKVGDRGYAAAFDACEICKDFGYVQQGDRLLCLNCTADINPQSLGEAGGCNPVPLRFAVRGAALVVKVSDLAARKDLFEKDFVVGCPVCKMQFKMSDSGGAVEGVPLCPMKECREEYLRGMKRE
ncbi:MAG: DUF2318 domain-containing protein [Planctomycetes bacterium]|nr:DUF2318 domain-containing protein [Planctomycetota bacterium]